MNTPWTYDVDYCTETGSSHAILGKDGGLIVEELGPEGTGKHLERAVECVNAMEPGGKVERLIRTVGHIAYALEQDGRTADGTTKAGAAGGLRRALEPFS